MSAVKIGFPQEESSPPRPLTNTHTKQVKVGWSFLAKQTDKNQYKKYKKKGVGGWGGSISVSSKMVMQSGVSCLDVAIITNIYALNRGLKTTGQCSQVKNVWTEEQSRP